MSNANAPKQRRSFKIIFKIFKFLIAMAFTFLISFAVTLTMKSDHPAEIFGTLSELFPQEDSSKADGATEIKTIFDDLNNRPFDLERVREQDSTVKDSVIDEKKTPAPSTPEPARQEEKLGFIGTISRMTSIKPAVEEKIKTIPHYVTIDKMPYLMCQAIVSVEDARFYKHKGFDIKGIARAAFVNVEAGEIQEGASTITQQTVKNLFLTSDRTFTRKMEELLLSMNMEKNFEKDEILEIYLNVIYFGSNFYGIYDAAHGYFGKEPADLTIAECAMLAGLPNAPSLNSPYVDFHRAKKRQLVVIDAMEKIGVINSREAESARIEEIILAH